MCSNGHNGQEQEKCTLHCWLEKTREVVIELIFEGRSNFWFTVPYCMTCRIAVYFIDTYSWVKPQKSCFPALYFYKEAVETKNLNDLPTIFLRLWQNWLTLHPVIFPRHCAPAQFFCDVIFLNLLLPCVCSYLDGRVDSNSYLRCHHCFRSSPSNAIRPPAATCTRLWKTAEDQG